MTTDLYSEVLPRLWLGGTADDDIVALAAPLPSLSALPTFDAVATLYAFAQPMGWHVHEWRYGFADAGLNPEVVKNVHEIADWLFERWTRGETVLARCQAGWNRSGLVTALVLIRAGMEPDDAIRLIRSRRSQHVLSNPDFETYVLSQRTSKGAA